jgi:hypothetical protein
MSDGHPRRTTRRRWLAAGTGFAAEARARGAGGWPQGRTCPEPRTTYL